LTEELRKKFPPLRATEDKKPEEIEGVITNESERDGTLRRV